jgi:dTDP-4-dehydrorhamnose reductase
MKPNSTTLIVGSDSFIGSALMSWLQSMGKPVLGTTRRGDISDKNHSFFDLSEDTRKWESPVSVGVAVICAGITKTEACRQNPEATFQVNVEGVTNLINNLVKRGVFIIYLSSNQVFDGSIPHRLSDDKFSPITEYGRQKIEVERRVSKLGDSVAIVRITKVLGPEFPLFTDWTKTLLKGEIIHPFLDKFMAPVSLSCVVSVLSILIERSLPGILQVSGNRDISYSEAACIGARLLKVNEKLVQPIQSAQLDIYSEPIPANTTLDISRLKLELGIEPVDVSEVVKMAFGRREEINKECFCNEHS